MKKKSISDGAIVPWAKTTTLYYAQTLSSLAKHYSFSLDEEYGTYGSVLKPNHTPRVEFDFYSFNHINRNIFIEFSKKLGFVSNDIDDFFHFFGGGLTGIKGYTFYDSSLTGSAIWINSTEIIGGKSIGFFAKKGRLIAVMKIKKKWSIDEIIIFLLKYHLSL